MLSSFLHAKTTTTISNFINKELSNSRAIDCNCTQSDSFNSRLPIKNPTTSFGFKLRGSSYKQGLTLYRPYLNSRQFSNSGSLIAQPLKHLGCHCDTDDHKSFKFKIDGNGHLENNSLEMTYKNTDAMGNTYLLTEGDEASSDQHVHSIEAEESYVHIHDGGDIAHTHTVTLNCIDYNRTPPKKGVYIKFNDASTNYCCTDYEEISGNCLDSSSVCHDTSSNNKGGDGPNGCLEGRFIDCSSSTPSSIKKYRGVNLSAYDNGSLAGGQADQSMTRAAGCLDASKNPAACGLCTDAIGDTGGYSIAHNSTANTPDTYNSLSARFTTGGKLAGYGQYDASSSPLGPLNTNMHYATVYTLTSQIDYAVNAGVNIFRIPFIPTFIDKLTTGWASKVIVDPSGEKRRAYIYLPPNPEYINFYMTTVNYIIETHGDKDIKIIIDNHAYQRWCPMNIPGTSSCLEADVSSAVAPPRKYSMNKTADNMCPYKVVEAVAGGDTELDALLKPINHDSWKDVAGNDASFSNITANNIGSWLNLETGGAVDTDGHYCKSAIDISNTSVTPFSDLSGNLKTVPSGCIDDTSGGNACYGPPTKRILGPDCTVTMWYNILNTEYKLLDISGNYRTADAGKGGPVSGTLKTYFSHKHVRPHIFIGLMNEPNEVNTDDLGKTYGMLFVLFRKMFYNNPLTLLVEGNSWAGLHAQCDPITRGLMDTSTNRITALKDYVAGAATEAWRTGEMEDISAALNKSHDSALKYFNLEPLEPTDFENYPCEIIRKAIETEMSKNNLEYLNSEKNPWYYDVHQYMDKNSTGGNACVNQQDQTKTVEPTYTIEDMEKFTNFIPFMKWAKHYNIKVIATEFGAQIQGDDAEPWGCNNRINLFIKMLEQKEYDDIIVGWTLWRAPPSTTWLVNVDTKEPVGLWTNSIIFGPPDNQWPQDSSAVFHKMYTVVKPFTDASFGEFEDISHDYTNAEKKTQFCMPELWNLRGKTATDNVIWKRYVPDEGWSK